LAEGVDLQGGPQACEALNANQIRFISSEPGLSQNRTRSFSLQPNRITGPPMHVGRTKNDGVDFSDSISLVEERRDFPETDIAVCHIQSSEPKEKLRRGRSRKHRDKSKHTSHSKVGLPKFVQLGEVLKDGGGRVRRRKKVGEVEIESEKKSGEGSEMDEGLQQLEMADADASGSAVGLMLEVVLPAICNTPKSWLQILQLENSEEGTQQAKIAALESSKLFQIQQKVGFNYKGKKDEVIKALDLDEQRDREKKKEWEQKRGFQ
jgi:hypothetical protein